MMSAHDSATKDSLSGRHRISRPMDEVLPPDTPTVCYHSEGIPSAHPGSTTTSWYANILPHDTAYNFSVATSKHELDAKHPTPRPPATEPVK